MLVFDKDYYDNNIPNVNHPHYLKRAKWIADNVDSGRVIITGAGFGWIVFHLITLGVDVIGIESSQYAFKQSKVKGNMSNKCVSLFPFLFTDNIFSWNFLDCLNDDNVEAVCDNLNKAGKQIHILCIDNDDKQSQDYFDLGYFIKSIDYWFDLLPDAIFINYHTGKISNSCCLKIPTSWDRISE